MMTYYVNLQIMTALFERVEELDIIKSSDANKIHLVGVMMMCCFRGEELLIYIDYTEYDMVVQFGNTCKLRTSLNNPNVFDMVIEEINSFYQSMVKYV